MVICRATGREANRALPKAAGFALHPDESLTVVEDEVVTGVFAEWGQHLRIMLNERAITIAWLPSPTTFGWTRFPATISSP